MLTGTIWLDYDDGEQDGRYEAKITKGLLTNDEIIIDFNGYDPDEGSFTGECRLKKQGSIYLGQGKFTVRGKPVLANVSVTLGRDGSSTILNGSWHDVGDSDAYTMTAELKG